MGIIYRIKTQNGTYIGKWSRNDDHSFLYDEHLKAALPWKDTVSIQSDRWEGRWKANLLQTGYNKDNYVYEAQYISLDNIVEYLKSVMPQTMFKIGQSKKELSCWEMLKKCWGKQDLETAEALCILACSQETTIENTKIDFFSSDLDPRTTSISTLLSVEELGRRIGAVQQGIFTVPIIRNFSSPNNFWDVITDDVDKFLRNLGLKRKNTADLSQNKAIAKSITKLVDDEVIKHMVASLENAKKKIIGGKGAQSARKNINNIISDVKKYKGKTEGELYTMIFDALSKSKDVYVDKLFQDKELFANIELLSEQLKIWVNNIKINNFFDTNGKNYNREKVEKKYKQEFTKFIQSLIEQKASYDSEYSTRQHEAYDAYMFVVSASGNHSFGKSFLPKNKLTDNGFLQDQILSLIPNNFIFVQEHWKYGINKNSIYGEQISIWLASYEDMFYHDRIFTWQPITPENITIY